MTIGIYKLNFPSTNLIYIGKSKNIEARFRNHLSSLKKRNGSLKLQWAYDTYGEPIYEILIECQDSELNFWEIQYISLFNSLEKGLNTLPGGADSPVMLGLDNPNSKYLEEDYFNVLYFLSEPGYGINEIAELTGVSKYVIQHIASEESHIWLKEKYPKLYEKMTGISKLGRNNAFQRGISYPKIMSPTGEIFEVKHQTNFAKEHNLLQSKLCQVLKGSRKSHKGWILV